LSLGNFHRCAFGRPSADAGLPFKILCPYASLVCTRPLKETTVLAPALSRQDRMAMYNSNKLKIGLFGANCSSGRAVTLVPERWSGGWAGKLKLARVGGAAGLRLLPPS